MAPKLSLSKRKVKVRHHRSKPGSAPGTLLLHKDFANVPVTVVVRAFNETDLLEKTLIDPEEILAILNDYKMVWINICGLGDVALLAKFAEILHLNPLAMEDATNVIQRPKIEEYNEVAFAVMTEPDIVNEALSLQQVSMFWR